MKSVWRTELVWNGKYGEQCNRHTVRRIALPFQVVETVNESKADREKAQRSMFPLMSHDDRWRNMLIWGDNKLVASSLLPRFAGKIKLIYIDPPFATGQNFSYRVRIGDEEFVKEPSIIEEKAYRDTWGQGLDSYLQMIYERLVLMHELLAEDGSIWVHLGWHVGHYVKIILDEIFGYNNFRNEIIVKRIRKNVREQEKVKRLNWGHDVIYFYAKSASNVITPPTIKVKRPQRWHSFEASGDSGTNYELFGFKPKPGTHWRWSKERAEKAIQEGKLRPNPRTGKPEYLVESSDEELVDTIWSDIPAYSFTSGYETEKSEQLLERIIRTASEEGDLVADFFCGSGTTLVVAEKLGRRWIGCDLSKWAIQVTRKRLLQVEGCKPFEILNLGNYERHKLAANGQWGRYVQFILQLYRAEPVTGFQTLHGKKARAYVHVGSVDSPITMREICQTLEEAQRVGAREVHFLGWDFEMGLHDLVHQVGDNHGVKVRLVSIPREALEVTDPAKEEVRFFDLSYLELEHKIEGKKLTIRLKDFIIANPEYIPEEIRKKITKFTDYIDYWAVDWDYKNDTFHNGWQSFRTRKQPTLETEAIHTYEQPGTYKVLVKVVDIFGNDTTKIVEVNI